MNPRDRLRCAALGASTAAMILVPTLGPVLAGTGEGAEEYDTDITPPNYAFAIWAPIFLSNAVGTVQHLANPSAEVNRRHGWWLAGAHAANAVWSLVAQSGRFRYTAAVLPVAAALAAQAHRRLQPGVQPGGVQAVGLPRGRPLHGDSGIAPHSTGLLLGWTSVASVVNVVAVRRRPPSARATASVVVGAAALLSAVVATSRRGYVAVAAAGGWALVTNALNPRRTRTARAANALGATLLAATTLRRLLEESPAQQAGGPFVARPPTR